MQQWVAALEEDLDGHAKQGELVEIYACSGKEWLGGEGWRGHGRSIAGSRHAAVLRYDHAAAAGATLQRVLLDHMRSQG